jgi:hypothetical protein
MKQSVKINLSKADKEKIIIPCRKCYWGALGKCEREGRMQQCVVFSGFIQNAGS